MSQRVATPSHWPLWWLWWLSPVRRAGVLNQVVSEWRHSGGMAAGGAPATTLDPRGCLTLHHILRAFTAPITEEHAWAIIHQVITSSQITSSPGHLAASSPGHLATCSPGGDHPG